MSDGPLGDAGAHLGDAISAYLDGELDEPSRRHADDHLGACAGCQVELDEVSFARTLVRSLPMRAAPPGLFEPAARTRRGWWWSAAAVAAAVTALLLPREHNVSPVVTTQVDAHAVRASVSGDPLIDLAPVAVPVNFER